MYLKSFHLITTKVGLSPIDQHKKEASVLSADSKPFRNVQHFYSTKETPAKLFMPNSEQPSKVE